MTEWTAWADMPEEVRAETARIMADTWKCPVAFARHHIETDRENDRLKARAETAESAAARLREALEKAKSVLEYHSGLYDNRKALDLIDAALASAAPPDARKDDGEWERADGTRTPLRYSEFFGDRRVTPGPMWRRIAKSDRRIAPPDGKESE